MKLFAVLALLLFFGVSVRAQITGPARKLATTTFTNLGTPQDGSVRYCSDCLATSPCTGGGTGADAARVNGVWNCSTGGSNSLTNGAGANVITKSDGTNLVVSTLSDDGTTVTGTGRVNFSVLSALSNPALKLPGAWITGGDATTTKPHFLIEPTGATSAFWNTAGTGLGVNAASGFTGDLANFGLNGVSKFKVDSTGAITSTTGAGGSFLNFGGGHLDFTSSGIWNLYDVSGANFNRLDFGGTTSSFPAIIRSAALIKIGLADASAGGGLAFVNLADSGTAPTISSGFGTSPSVTTSNGTIAFTINVGTGGTATNGVIGLPTATNGWVCWGNDLTTQSTTVFYLKQIASSTTTATIANYNTAGAQAAWVASDILSISCRAR